MGELVLCTISWPLLLAPALSATEKPPVSESKRTKQITELITCHRVSSFAEGLAAGFS